MTTLDPDQCDPHEITKIRIFFNHEGDGHDWNVDGTDDRGRYTEACARFASKDEAMDAIPEFVAGLGLSGSYPIEIADGPAKS